MEDHIIRNEVELQALFGPIGEASVRKEVAFLHPIYQRWIVASPFAVVATSGPRGLDVSPRGDPAPLVRVLNERTLLLPERRGNNRADGLRNLISDPRIALLFLVPGIGETLRVNGKATISIEPELLRSFAVGDALPKCVVRIDVDAVFFHCARAFLRSRLWDIAVDRASVPSAGEMLAAITQGELGGQTYDQALAGRQRGSLY